MTVSQRIRQSSITAAVTSDITFTSLGTPDVQLADQTSYTTPAISVTSGVAVYACIEGSKAAGDLADPTTVTCSNGDSLTKISPILTWGSFVNKTWIYGFIPTTTGSVTLTCDWGAVTLTQFASNIVQAAGVYTAGGISGTYLIDSNVHVPTNANSTACSVPVQAAWDTHNAYLCFFLIGGSSAVPTASAGTPVKIADVPNSGVGQFSTWYKTGGADAIGVDWAAAGSLSNHQHMVELKANGSTSPTLRAEIIGTPIHTTTGATTHTYASISPQNNSLLVLLAETSATAGNLRTVSSISGTLAVSWTQVGTNLDHDTAGTPIQRMTVWTAPSGVGNSGTVIMNVSATDTGASMVIVEITGAATSSYIVQSATNTGDAGTAVALASPMSAFGNANNGTLAFVGEDLGSPTPPGNIAGAGFEKLEEGGYSNPSSTSVTIWRHSNDTTPTSTASGTADWGIFALEVKSAT